MQRAILRTFMGYSRFALEEERKHKGVIGTFLVNHYKNLYHNLGSIEGIAIGSQNAWLLKNRKIPNLALDFNNILAITSMLSENLYPRVENQTKIIQYQANNGIEDRVVAAKLKVINAETVSVFDGHGGDKLSDYCSNHIVDLLETFISENIKNNKYSNNQQDLIIESLKYAYQKLETDFYDHIYTPLSAMNNRKIKNVGTCALTVIVYNKKVYVANCGDSQALLVSKSADGQISYIELNQRLSVNNPAERERLAAEFPDDTDIVVEQQGGSYYLKGRLQPTRSIGDYHLKHAHLFKGKGKFNGPYVKSEPQIKVFPLNNEHQTIVVASDGVWDFLDKSSVAQSSLKQNPHEQILDRTLQKVAQIHKKSISEIMQVQAEQKRAFHDDISIAVVKLGSSSKQITPL